LKTAWDTSPVQVFREGGKKGNRGAKEDSETKRQILYEGAKEVLGGGDEFD